MITLYNGYPKTKRNDVHTVVTTNMEQWSKQSPKSLNVPGK